MYHSYDMALVRVIISAIILRNNRNCSTMKWKFADFFLRKRHINLDYVYPKFCKVKYLCDHGCLCVM